MRLRKVQYRDYCFIKPNAVRYDCYFKIDSFNYYMISNSTIGYCVWYDDKKFYI
jgi:hypothetical protein